jgi:hypothetical protein
MMKMMILRMTRITAKRKRLMIAAKSRKMIVLFMKMKNKAWKKSLK